MVCGTYKHVSEVIQRIIYVDSEDYDIASKFNECSFKLTMEMSLKNFMRPQVEGHMIGNTRKFYCRHSQSLIFLRFPWNLVLILFCKDM